MSTCPQPRDYRFVNQVDRGGRPDADRALQVSQDRITAAAAAPSIGQPTGPVEPALAEIRVSLENHIARINALRRRATAHDRKGRIAEALRLLQDLERELAIAAKEQACAHELEVSPSGNIAECRLCGFVGRWRDGMWQKVNPAPEPPLLSLGQGDYRRDLGIEASTGKLVDLRA